MAKIDDLIEKLCPNGVEYKPIWSLTAWDKKFNGIDKEKQKKIISYKYYLSTDFAKVERKDGNIKYISTGISGDDRYTTEELAGDYLADGEVVCIPWGGTPNVKYYKGKFVTGDNRIATSLDINILSNKFLYYWMQSKINVISKFYRGSGIKHPSMKDVLDMNIAVPPLEVQCEIVHILDDFTLLSAELSAELKARRKQYEYYKKTLFENKNIELKTLKELATNCDNKRKPITSGNREKGEYHYYGASGIVDYVKGYIFDGDYLLISEDGANLVARKTPIAFSISGKNWVNNHAHVLKFSNMYLQKYVEMYLNYINIEQYISGAAQPKLNQVNLNKIVIPIPNNDTLKNIVDILLKFDKITNDISEGLPAEIEARQKQYEYYRDKLLTFKELKVNE